MDDKLFDLMMDLEGRGHTRLAERVAGAMDKQAAGWVDDTPMPGGAAEAPGKSSWLDRLRSYRENAGRGLGKAQQGLQGGLDQAKRGIGRAKQLLPKRIDNAPNTPAAPAPRVNWSEWGERAKTGLGQAGGRVKSTWDLAGQQAGALSERAAPVGQAIGRGVNQGVGAMGQGARSVGDATLRAGDWLAEHSPFKAPAAPSTTELARDFNQQLGRAPPGAEVGIPPGVSQGVSRAKNFLGQDADEVVGQGARALGNTGVGQAIGNSAVGQAARGVLQSAPAQAIGGALSSPLARGIGGGGTLAAPIMMGAGAAGDWGRAMNQGLNQQLIGEQDAETAEMVFNTIRRNKERVKDLDRQLLTNPEGAEAMALRQEKAALMDEAYRARLQGGQDVGSQPGANSREKLERYRKHYNLGQGDYSVAPEEYYGGMSEGELAGDATEYQGLGRELGNSWDYMRGGRGRIN